VVAVDAAAAAWAEGARVGGWSHARARGAREWAAGWDRSAPAPAAPAAGDTSPGGRGWRHWTGHEAGRRARALHATRCDVVHDLRRAGYLTRHRWAREAGPGGRYTAGACQGLRAVDPWAEARALGQCGARWAVHLRLTAGVLCPAPAPLPCNRAHLCPVCAASKSADFAAAVRRVVAGYQAQNVGAAAVLVTLTQRADPAETLSGALRRLRLAWSAVRGRDEYKRGTAGAFWGYEVTHRPGRGWHAHLHAVVVVPAGQRLDDVRAGIGRAWQDESDRARPGFGWLPSAGGCKTARRRFAAPDLCAPVRNLRALCGGGASLTRWAGDVRGASRLTRGELVAKLRGAWAEHTRRYRWRVVSWSGEWWQRLDTLDRVHEAAKYPTPAARLTPWALAEFCTVARGRRWHEGAGILRGVLARAAELEPEGEGNAEAGAGPIVTQTRPSAVPDLDVFARGAGWADAAPALAPACETPAVARWAVAAAFAGCPVVAAAAAAAGLTYWIGPAPGHAGPLQPAGDGQAPDAGAAVWLVGDGAALAAALAAAAPRPGRVVPRARPRRRGRHGPPPPPAWSARPLP